MTGSGKTENGAAAPEGAGDMSGAAKPDPAATPGTGGTPVSRKEIGGRGGADPTRFGDWEVNGRCVDF